MGKCGRTLRFMSHLFGQEMSIPGHSIGGFTPRRSVADWREGLAFLIVSWKWPRRIGHRRTTHLRMRGRVLVTLLDSQRCSSVHYVDWPRKHRVVAGSVSTAPGVVGLDARSSTRSARR
jgi:hypothetical protein